RVHVAHGRPLVRPEREGRPRPVARRRHRRVHLHRHAPGGQDQAGPGARPRRTGGGMAPMTYEHIALEVDGSVATITLNRPDKLNAFTTRMQHELVDAFDRTDADDDVRVVIVTGAGRAFCAGADLSSGSSAFDAGERAGGGEGSVPEDGGGEVTLRIWRSHKPVIAAINGPAVGVGITMTLPMDIRLASDAA